MIEEHAAAKINLALHVTGQQPDGYHLLDTLVTFTDAGDTLTFKAARENHFTVSGRFAPALLADGQPKPGNLVITARDAVAAYAGAMSPVHIHLEKSLPIASGIGGGSADAAATLRGLIRFWNLEIPQPALNEIALRLGADVPMCLASLPLVARGIGEHIIPVDTFPKLHLLLVNPLVEVSTPMIFKSLTNKVNSPLDLPPDSAGDEDWIAMIIKARNDLQPPAEVIENRIVETLGLLQATGPILARMSGSGATCFGIYATLGAARAARAALEAVKPEWYLQETDTI